MREDGPHSGWVLIFAAWLVPALLAAFNSYAQSRLESHSPEWRWVLFNSLDWLIYALLTPAVFRASRRLPFEHPHLTRNVSLHVIGALFMCVAWAALGTALRFVIFPRPAAGESAWLGFVSWVFTTPPLSLLDLCSVFAALQSEESLTAARQGPKRTGGQTSITPCDVVTKSRFVTLVVLECTVSFR